MTIDLARWRMEKANKTFQEGIHLLEANFLSGAVNRFYYALFTGIRAILATKGLDSAKHSGVISLFNRNFVKSGLISKNASKVIIKAFSERSHADYADFKDFEIEEVKEIEGQVRKLLEEFDRYLN